MKRQVQKQPPLLTPPHPTLSPALPTLHPTPALLQDILKKEDGMYIKYAVGSMLEMRYQVGGRADSHSGGWQVGGLNDWWGGTSFERKPCAFASMG